MSAGCGLMGVLWQEIPGGVDVILGIVEEAASRTPPGQPLEFQCTVLDLDTVFAGISKIAKILALHPGSEEKLLRMVRQARRAYIRAGGTVLDCLDPEYLSHKAHAHRALPIVGGGCVGDDDSDSDGDFDAGGDPGTDATDATDAPTCITKVVWSCRPGKMTYAAVAAAAGAAKDVIRRGAAGSSSKVMGAPVPVPVPSAASVAVAAKPPAGIQAIVPADVAARQPLESLAALEKLRYIFVPVEALAVRMDFTVDCIVFAVQCMLRGSPPFVMPQAYRFSWYVCYRGPVMKIYVQDPTLGSMIREKLEACGMVFGVVLWRQAPGATHECEFGGNPFGAASFHRMCRCHWMVFSIPTTPSDCRGLMADDACFPSTDFVARDVELIKMRVQLALAGAELTVGFTYGSPVRVSLLSGQEAISARDCAGLGSSHTRVVHVSMAERHVRDHVVEYFGHCVWGPALVATGVGMASGAGGGQGAARVRVRVLPDSVGVSCRPYCVHLFF